MPCLIAPVFVFWLFPDDVAYLRGSGDAHYAHALRIRQAIETLIQQARAAELVQSGSYA